MGDTTNRLEPVSGLLVGVPTRREGRGSGVDAVRGVGVLVVLVVMD